MNEREKIIARIRKLLALARSENAHEASAAMERAQAMMAAHEIDHDALDLASIGAVASDFRGSAASRPPVWDLAIRGAVCGAFRVRCVRDWKQARWVLLFYGERSHAELAAYAYSVLGRQCAQSRKRYFDQQRKSVKRTTRIARADKFAEAWVVSATRTLKRFHKTEREKELLVLFEESHWPDLETIEGRAAKKARGDDRASADGYAAGRNARLDVPVSAAPAPALITHS